MVMHCGTCTRAICPDHFPALKRIKAQKKKSIASLLVGITFQCPYCWYTMYKDSDIFPPYIVSKVSTSHTYPSALTRDAGVQEGQPPRFS